VAHAHRWLIPPRSGATLVALKRLRQRGARDLPGAQGDIAHDMACLRVANDIGARKASGVI